MAIRMTAKAIWTAAVTAVVPDQHGDARDIPTPTSDAGYRPLRTGVAREPGGGVKRPKQSARPWPSHVLRTATPDSDALIADTDLPCRR